MTLRGRGAADQKWLSRKGEGIYDPEVLGRRAKKSLGEVEAGGPY